MKAELITIGDEILIGQIVNTNSVFLAKALNNIGIEITQITSISDKKDDIISTLKLSEKRVKLVILTGGLGPTSDDLTKQTLCTYFNDKLIENKEILDHIEEIFKKYVTTPINDQNRKQAFLPSKAKIFKNNYGTASGMWFEKNRQVIISLPGVPFEMKSLMINEVIPKLQNHFIRPFIVHKTIITYGLGESAIAEIISTWEKSLPDDLKLAYLPNLGRVRLRISGKGPDRKLVNDKIDREIDKLLPLIKDIFVGYEDVSPFEEKIQSQFLLKNQTLSLAESCTGGEISARLAKIPGASKYFVGSIISYQTQSKSDLLSIPQNIIERNSVVSKQVAEMMAQNVRKKFNSSIGVATTGNAGPSKGDSDAEIGTVWIAISSDKRIISERFIFGKHRERVIGKAVNKALEMVYREII
tara:strand:- start:70921 stop:72162 length:1242 start_codon:yes stop_codon:yes gene_type:complete